MTKFIGEETARLAGLQVDQLQKLRDRQMTLDQIHYFNNLTFEQREALATGGVFMPDSRFFYMSEFRILVPKGHNRLTQLASFRSKHFKKFIYYNPDITDENFSQPSVVLVAGQQFTVKVFGIKKDTTVDSKKDILPFLRAQGAKFVGAQGLSLAWDQKKADFPVDKWALSFDEEEKLPFLDGYHGVPSARRSSDGYSGFSLGDFGYGWGDGCVLLCFCDLPLPSA